MEKKIVIALGGNALGADIEEQKSAVANTAKVIVDLVSEGYKLIVTHGNGPQVGMIQDAMDYMQKKNLKKIPLPTCVAMSQGYIGIDLQNAIKYELYKRNIDKKVSTILSQVEVSKDDPAFLNPTKPIGKFLTKEEADEHEANGIPCIEDAGRGYRAVVPSPMPVAIKELKTIQTLLDNDHIVITCGGGGIPVINENGKLVGTNAVIDKDNVSSLLATKLDADFLVILTAVEKVAIDFGKPNQKWISEMSVNEAKQYINEGQFAKGSMLPKVEAAVSFVQSSNNKKALITLLEKAADGIAGKTGTVIHL